MNKQFLYTATAISGIAMGVSYLINIPVLADIFGFLFGFTMGMMLVNMFIVSESGHVDFGQKIFLAFLCLVAILPMAGFALVFFVWIKISFLGFLFLGIAAISFAGIIISLTLKTRGV